MISTRRSVVLMAVPLVCLSLCPTVRASYQVATISGVVADATGAPLGEAHVTLSGDGIATLRIITDTHGHYRFPAILPHHVCSVAAERQGFRSVVYDGMLSESGRTRIVNFRLKHPNDLDIVVLVTRDPFPYEEFVRGLTARAGVPVRVEDLDRETDPAEAVRRVRAEHPNLIVGAGLRSARLIRREIVDVPSILTLITDPRRHDLESETIGILMNQPDADDLFERVASVLPHLHRVGLVYQADTSSLLAHDLRMAAEHRGFAVELAPCRSIDDLPRALDELRGRIDALVVPNDDMTSTRRAQDIMISWSLKNHVPLAAPMPDWVQRGALLSYGPSYERLGEEASRVAGQILHGEFQPADLHVTRSRDFDLAVNQSTAAVLGIEIPCSLKIDTIY
jgi:putative tryptophan/tyrosine transport system substrate-binding protein